jgi:ribosome-associated protein
MPSRPRVTASGDLEIAGVTVPAREIRVRTTTAGGPGGQHANRVRSRVVVSFDIQHSESLTEDVRDLLVATLGPSVRSSSSTSRSQSENRQLAMERLARRLGDALDVPAPRTATRPTRASVERRIADKRRRSAAKRGRREPGPDD